MKGILVVNKPINMTSHDVVAILRRKLGIKRIGHTGTLDPMATGVLPICIGNATRVSEYIMEQGKAYIAKMKFGKSTTTYDFTGETVESSDRVIFSKEEIEEKLECFKGDILQKPPMYSAIKIDGKKLYEMARNGKTVDIPAREVKVYEINIISLNDEELELYIKCSKGTYIRSIIHDLGISLGSFAYMTALERVQVGKFKIEDSTDIFKIRDMELADVKKLLKETDSCLYNLDSFYISQNFKEKLLSGQKIDISKIGYKYEERDFSLGKNSIKVYSGDDFLGIGSLNDKILKMERVLY